MKKIPYKKKATTANTQYNQTTSTDLKHILNECKRLVEVATECERQGITDGKKLYSNNGIMPRQSSGKMNSPKTMCEGVIDNFNKGQYDLSDPQMKGITESFRVAHDVIEDFEEVVFEEVTNLPKLNSTKVFDTSTIPDSTLSDLWEIDSMTFRRK